MKKTIGFRALRSLFFMTTKKMFGTVTHVLTQERIVALTFDDGPHPEFTSSLLQILEKHRAKATFFMLGISAQKYPEIVKKVAQSGHAIGNHSWDHPSFPYILRRERRAQIRAGAKALAPYEAKLFRPPYCDQSIMSRLDAFLLGYQVVLYSIAAPDWTDHDADWIVDQVIDQIEPGSVIIFHDALHDTLEERYADRRPTLEAVNLLLERLAGRYRFVTVPKLLKCGRPQRQHFYQRADKDFLNNLKVIEGEARRYT